MNRHTIMITTELENPDNPSSGDNMPVNTNKTSEDKATMSDRILPQTKNVTVRRMIPKTIRTFMSIRIEYS